jgi:hypothetical protein
MIALLDKDNETVGFFKAGTTPAEIAAWCNAHGDKYGSSGEYVLEDQSDATGGGLWIPEGRGYETYSYGEVRTLN